METLLSTASRQRCKDLIGVEIRKLQTELLNLQNEVAEEGDVKKPVNTVRTGPKVMDVKLNNYAWDQNSDYVKLYVTLEGVHNFPKEAAVCKFTDRSLDLHVLTDNKKYNLAINNLAENIDPVKSHIKVKTNMVLINLAKNKQKQWTCVTGVEKRIKDLKDAKNDDMTKMTDKGDPESTLMNLMKQMYQNGDDDMKRTIAKAWCESQEKKVNTLSDDLANM